MLMEKSFEIIRKSKKYILASCVIFFLSFLMGNLFVKFYPELALSSLDELTTRFSFLFDFSPLQMGTFIFINNSVKVFLFMILGVFLAIPTLIFIIFNGWVLGFVASLVYPEIGVEGLFYGLFLHGIFELSAIFIGAGIGMFLGVKLIKKRARVEELKEEMKKATQVFAVIILPLLFIAALIETLIMFYY